ncbi:MAG: RNB domain-containing ribonuclease [Acidimicrobiales bacterium]|nr:RNB domain-containing ribonuclease [Acidimicrobiales bacterium]
MHRHRHHRDLDLSPVWDDLDLPRRFPDEVEAAAAAARDERTAERRDATDIAFITVDPPGAMDLDQALHLADRPGGGWTVHYAIADVAALVPPEGPVDVEARHRGETLYLPDGRVPLHPPVLGEGSASLLPDVDRPAVLWTIDLDDTGATDRIAVERAVVRSRSRHDYDELQAAFDAGTPPEPAAPLRAIGEARQALARERGAIELGLPSQEVVRRDDGSWTIEHRLTLPVEGWNAQLSLLTGMAAARLMIDGGIGLLRTLPTPDKGTVRRLRRAAPGLGVDWPDGAAPSDVIADLDHHDPRHAAFLDRAATLLRGAGYTAFDGEVPADTGHAGVANPYAHVTAPIRRLGDRFATEICLALHAGTAPPGWVRAALADLPEVLQASGRRANAVERTSVDHVEAWLLSDRIGEVFEVAVIDHDDDRDRSTVVLDDPAVEAPCNGRPPLGARIDARLIEADLATRRVRFEPA